MLTKPASFGQVALTHWMDWTLWSKPSLLIHINRSLIDLIWHHILHIKIRSERRRFIYTCEGERGRIFVLTSSLDFCLTSVDLGLFASVWPRFWLVLEAEIFCGLLTEVDRNFAPVLGRWPTVDSRSTSVLWSKFDCSSLTVIWLNFGPFCSVTSGWNLALSVQLPQAEIRPLLFSYLRLKFGPCCRLTWTSVDYFLSSLTGLTLEILRSENGILFGIF